MELNFNFFFPLRVNSNITWFYCAGDKKYCSCIVHRSHNTIHILKNYFATVFLVFSFSKNKFNPNGPYVSYFLFHIVEYTCVNEILNCIIIKKKWIVNIVRPKFIGLSFWVKWCPYMFIYLFYISHLESPQPANIHEYKCLGLTFSYSVFYPTYYNKEWQ